MNGTKVDRTEQLRALMGERDHLEDCPQKRVEAYPDIKPARPDQGQEAKPVTVVHCCDCGGTKVIGKPHEELLAELSDDKEAGNGTGTQGGRSQSGGAEGGGSQEGSGSRPWLGSGA